MSASRRAFIRGEWNPADPEVHSIHQHQVEIVSLVVSAWPQHLDQVAEDILALGNIEIHGRDSCGKLIVVLEEESQGAIGAKANTISGLPHVLSATMVFQASDDDEGVA